MSDDFKEAREAKMQEASLPIDYFVAGARRATPRRRRHAVAN
jgi:hypothetical protein